jgi:hypothetical protein
MMFMWIQMYTLSVGAYVPGETTRKHALSMISRASMSITGSDARSKHNAANTEFRRHSASACVGAPVRAAPTRGREAAPLRGRSGDRERERAGDARSPSCTTGNVRPSRRPGALTRGVGTWPPSQQDVREGGTDVRRPAGWERVCDCAAV